MRKRVRPAIVPTVKESAGGGNRTLTGGKPHRILSPARLPVSPLRHQEGGSIIATIYADRGLARRFAGGSTVPRIVPAVFNRSTPSRRSPCGDYQRSSPGVSKQRLAEGRDVCGWPVVASAIAFALADCRAPAKAARPAPSSVLSTTDSQHSSQLQRHPSCPPPQLIGRQSARAYSEIGLTEVP